MRKLLVSKDGSSKVTIFRDKSGEGIYFKGTSEEGGVEYTEALGILKEIIDFLIPDDPRDFFINPDLFLPDIPTIPLPEDTPSWIVEVSFYIKGGKVLASQESLKYFEDLLKYLQGVKPKTEVEDINRLRRIMATEKIYGRIKKRLTFTG